MGEVHIQYTSATVRWYEENRSYENKDPYDAVATVQFIGDNIIFISAMHGTVTRDMLRALARKALTLNITKVLAVRHGQITQYSVEKYLR